MELNLAALEAAYSFIRVRDRFPSEVEARLLSKEFEPAEVDRVLEYLRHKHVLKPEKSLAISMAEQLAVAKNWAPSRISQELESRGASRESIEVALVHLPDESKLAEKALKDLKSKSLAQKTRKLFALGFSEETIHSLLELP